MPRKKKTRRRKTKKTAAGGRGRPSRLASASLTELQAEIHRRHSALQARRDELAAELDAIDREIGGARVWRGPGRPRAAATAAPARRRGRPPGKRGPGRPAKKKRGRPRGKRPGGGLSLVESLHRVLQGTTLSVAEVSEAVQKAGYKTKSANFRTIVNQALTANPNKFRKVARGQYTAK